MAMILAKPIKNLQPKAFSTIGQQTIPLSAVRVPWISTPNRISSSKRSGAERVMHGKNIRNTTAKERMLKKIRQALLQKRDNPYPYFEDAPLYVEDDTPITVLFAEQFT